MNDYADYSRFELPHRRLFIKRDLEVGEVYLVCNREMARDVCLGRETKRNMLLKEIHPHVLIFEVIPNEWYEPRVQKHVYKVAVSANEIMCGEIRIS